MTGTLEATDPEAFLARGFGRAKGLRLRADADPARAFVSRP